MWDTNIVYPHNVSGVQLNLTSEDLVLNSAINSFVILREVSIVATQVFIFKDRPVQHTSQSMK